LSTAYTVGDLVTVKVEKIVPRGYGLAFAEKLTVFVPLSVPGDVVTARITHLKKRTAFAEIVEIVTPGSERVVPPCPYFGTCGGCNFQQLDYQAQLTAKADIITDCLVRIGKLEPLPAISLIPSPREYDYRSRVRWQIDSSQRRFGYFRRDSNEVVDVAACPVLSPPLKRALENIRATLDWSNFFDNGEVVAACGDEDRASMRSSVGIEPADEIACTVLGEVYEFSAETFFQANHLLLSDLIECAISDAAGETALDLYSGVGLFSIPLARKFANVISVEGDPRAVEFAKKNVKHANLSNLRVLRDGVGRFLSQKPWEADFVLIDPPRSGTEKGVIDALISIGPSQISYVSCEPSILARDLRTLVDGGYRIESIKALDLFPQTHHVETVVRLTKS
jgi:tRNA/tmRNA/rRNA uracil-C5-methylase (TrmA/RlmC/RlmD family)